MNIVCFQHVAFETPGYIATWAQMRGHRLRPVRTDREDPATALREADALVVLGGPMGVHDDALHPWLTAEKAALRAALERGLPTLGICLGAQLIADALGARVFKGAQREIGWLPVVSSDDIIGQGATFTPLLWHGDVFTLPAGARPIGGSAACELQGFRYRDHVLALLFHLEMTRSGLTRTDRPLRQRNRRLTHMPAAPANVGRKRAVRGLACARRARAGRLLPQRASPFAIPACLTAAARPPRMPCLAPECVV